MTKTELAKLVKRLDAAQTHYELLAVPPGAREPEIKAAHRALASVLHPDRSAHKDASRLMALVNVAYTCLTDKEARRRYDALTKVTKYECPRCSGTGRISKQQGFKMAQKATCPMCAGSGVYSV